MATNKQPMLVGTVLDQQVTVGALPCISTPGNWNTPSPGGLIQLCSGGNDGALIDSASVLATEASTTTSNVLLFITDQPAASLISAANTRLVAWAQIIGATPGARAIIPLPSILAPVPSLGSPAATVAAYPSETDKKNTGLFLQAGQYLYAGVDVALTTPSAATRVIVCIQGGYY